MVQLALGLELGQVRQVQVVQQVLVAAQPVRVQELAQAQEVAQELLAVQEQVAALLEQVAVQEQVDVLQEQAAAEAVQLVKLSRQQRNNFVFLIPKKPALDTLAGFSFTLASVECGQH